MGLINWIFDIYQHTKIDEARREAADMRVEMAQMRTSTGGVDTGRVERALGELALSLKTMQRMMVEKGVCSHEELAGKLREVDLEDGRADGQAPY